MPNITIKYEDIKKSTDPDVQDIVDQIELNKNMQDMFDEQMEIDLVNRLEQILEDKLLQIVEDRNLTEKEIQNIDIEDIVNYDVPEIVAEDIDSLSIDKQEMLSGIREISDFKEKTIQEKILSVDISKMNKEKEYDIEI